MTFYADTPWGPSANSDAYQPDQLVAGNLKLVTDTATITGGAQFVRGTVLGMITVGAITTTFAGAGNGTLTLPVAGPRLKAGAYTVRLKSATTFDVVDPDGVQLAEGLALGAYSDAEIGFTITAGATPFAAGDTFTLTAAPGSGSYTIANAAATDGSAVPCAILVDFVDCTAADQTGGIYEMGEFNANKVTLGTGITLAAAKAALQRRGIFLRAALTADDPIIP